VLRLWLRIVAAAAAAHPSSDVDPAAKKHLGEWVQAVRGCSELDTSAPGPQWLMDVFGAASDFCELIPAETMQRAAELVLPAVTASPAGSASAEPPADEASDEPRADGGEEKVKPPMSMPEALIIIAGQLNRNGYVGERHYCAEIHAACRAHVLTCMHAASDVCRCGCGCAVTCAGTLCGTCSGQISTSRSDSSLRLPCSTTRALPTAR
jgi:hypothetical protein